MSLLRVFVLLFPTFTYKIRSCEESDALHTFGLSLQALIYEVRLLNAANLRDVGRYLLTSQAAIHTSKNRATYTENKQ